jgi:membrane-bound metal-dependent hydrolase YbcI (DUF457 family)
MGSRSALARQGTKGRPPDRARSNPINKLDLIAVIFAPLIVPLALWLYGDSSDIEELWAVLFGPIVYLVFGMAVSSYRTARLYARSTNPNREELVKHLHDKKVASLFFLAFFEGSACLLALEPEAPVGVLIFAGCFYLPYVVWGVLWLKDMSRLQTAE